MAGPSLSHILDPPRPASDPNLVTTSSYTPAAVTAASSSAAPVSASAYSQQQQQFQETPLNSSSSSRHPHQTPTPTPPSAAAAAAGRGHTGTSLYACGDCGRRYSRPEHLQRHVQTHTLGRRFSCSICGKSFARADLKKRHEANHDNDSTKKRRRTAASPGAGRVAHACKACAAARVKCQEEKPCQRCVNRGLTCVSSEAGSAAAMHLMHLSANAHSSAQTSPGSVEGSTSPNPFIPRRAPNSVEVGTHQMLDRGSPSLRTPPVKAEEGQLLTPDTVMEHGAHDNYQPVMDPNTNPEGNSNIPFTDFLRDVLYEQNMDQGRLVENQGLAVLDFCNNSNMELTDMDFGLLDNWNVDGMVVQQSMPIQQDTPRTDTSVDIAQMRQNLVKVWTDSPWRWDPKVHDTGYQDQNNLPIPAGDTSSAKFQEGRNMMDRVVKQKLEQSSRDRVLAIVLAICQQHATSTRVAAAFPSADVLDTLVHIFLNSHACQVSEWIHFPTFKLNDQWPEWVAVAAAGGSVLTPYPTLRKFGLALQEAVRLTIPNRFEDNNTTIQNLGLVQSLILGQDIGLWCGNRRKMEIAECHLAIPVTMMRYRGKFKRSSYPTIEVNAADEGNVLEAKWRKWVEMEQWKRLVFHCYLRDSQTSMTTLTNPNMSYSELSLPLPEASELWFAKSAVEWKALYLERNVEDNKQAPSVGDLFHDIHLLPANRHRLDVQLSVSVFLHGFWALILEYRSLSAVNRSRSYTSNMGGTANLLLNSRHAELVKDLQNLQMIMSEWRNVSAQEYMLLHVLLMNLHVSLDDLQLFAGKEGEDQARRMYPVLQQWSESPESRYALWNAGQILRYAKLFPHGHLKDFYAISVHHAALALWTHAVVSRASRRQPVPMQYEPIYLDGSDTMALSRLISFGQGRPLIRGPATREGATEASADDPRMCMEVIQQILKANFTIGLEGLPPIVENLCQLIHQLGNAAWAVGLG